MGFVTGRCPLCGEETTVPLKVEQCYCSSCGQQVLAGAAIAFAAGDLDASTNLLENDRRNDGGSSAAPFLSQWSTRKGVAATGIILALSANSAVTFLSRYQLEFTEAMIILLSSLAYIAFNAIYAAIVYPSLFKDDPLAKSSASVSFLNGFFGGPIFGCLWCHNLTRKNKGVSYIVMTILCVLALSGCIYVLFF